VSNKDASVYTASPRVREILSSIHATLRMGQKVEPNPTYARAQRRPGRARGASQDTSMVCWPSRPSYDRMVHFRSAKDEML